MDHKHDTQQQQFIISYLEFIFLGVLLFFVSCVNDVNVCAIFLANCVLGLAVSPEVERGFLPKFSVIFRVFLQWKKFL